MMANPLPFKGRVGVGMGLNVAKEPIPHPSLEGEGTIALHDFFWEKEVCQFVQHLVLLRLR